MAIERVTIIDLEASALHVNAQDRRHCAQCVAKAGCGQQLLHTLFGARMQVLRLPRSLFPDAEYCPGDKVDIHIDDGRIAALSLLLYVAPAAALLVTTTVVSQVATATGAGEGWVIGSALIALAAGLACTRSLSVRLEGKLYTMLDIVGSKVATSATNRSGSLI